MTVVELKLMFERCQRTIRSERAMRARVFADGHPQRDEKLAEMDQLLADVIAMKDELKLLMAVPEQASLFPELVGSEETSMGDYTE